MDKRILILIIAVGVVGILILGGVFYYIGVKEEKKQEQDAASQQDEEKGGETDDKIDEQKAPEKKPETETSTTTKKSAFPDTGDFKIVYAETENPKYANLNNIIKNSGVFENLADFLNQILILQKDFPIIFGQCDTVNAFYSPQEKRIIICDELLENFGENFAYFTKTEEELDTAITDATYFILFHELGHGLIDVYDLVYSGKEEDVVDQLATVILLNLSEEGARAAVTGANYFYLTSSQIGEGYPFWDEHSLNQQRYYNILCWVYGSNPQKYGSFVGAYGLPQERAVWCEREYQKMSDFWDVAIYPFVQEKIRQGLDKNNN
jgi:hypothetical protein